MAINILNEKRRLIDSISPSFCAAKWLQTTLYLQNGYNHSCHHPAPHKIPVEEVKNNPAALHNSQYKKIQREKMLAGKRPKECQYCWNIEDLGKDYFSDRHYKTADYWAWDKVEEIAKFDPTQDINPAYLEVSFSNACNFKCVYCSPEISSRWLEEIQQHGTYPTTQGNHDLDWLRKTERFPYKHSDNNPYVNAFWDWFPNIVNSLKVFRITGGEPLMSKDVWRVLDYIIHNPQPNLELVINSNLCVEKKLLDRFIELLPSLKDSVNRVSVYTSLESVGAQAEYARYGLDYDIWLTNVKRILDTDTDIGVMTTINVLSLPTFCDFIDIIMDLRIQYNKKYNMISLPINYLIWPPYLNVKILDNDTRYFYAEKVHSHCRKYLNNLMSYEEWDQIQRFCDYLKQGDQEIDNKKDFILFIKEIDKRRNTFFVDVFPQLAEFYNG
jgi:MoaA/NifB/PqqE/SkfB family radical SAM enzyme